MANRTHNTTGLRYVDAHSVWCAEGVLANFRVCTSDAEPLGSVSGVLISPASRRLEYLVVESHGLFVHRNYLVPADAGAAVHEPETLRLSAKKAELNLQSFQPQSVPGFTEGDLHDAA